MKMRKITALVLAMLMVLALGACKNDTKPEAQEGKMVKVKAEVKNEDSKPSEVTSKTDTEETTPAEATKETTEEIAEETAEETTEDEIKVVEFEENPIVVLETLYGSMEIELYPEIAPITVSNFVKLVEEGFYDGLTFHRVIDGFMIQGGDPKGNGTGGSDTKIKGEFTANGVENNLSHERGVISMARAYDFDSASSQFFIMHADYPGLDGQYAAFGKVLSGIEVVDAVVANSPVVDKNGTVLPDNQVEIVSIYLK